MQTHLIFYIVAGLLMLAEAFSPGTFIFICFAVATFIVGFVDQITDLNMQILLGMELGLSILALFTVRPILKMIIKIPAQEDPSKYGSYAEKLIGKEAMVFKGISNQELGVVKLYDFDETWLAKSDDGSEIGQGSTVEIKSMDGNHLVVSSK